MNELSGKRVLIGVGGGIAAYKAVDLVRRLGDAGAEVRVMMSGAATAFVTPLTFQAVSGHPVRTALLDAEAEAGMDHIELARWPDLVVLAPATADRLARLAGGRADDLIAAVALATRAPVAVAPAMNSAMWENPATRANVTRLGERGVRVWGPESGALACGEEGSGRLLEVEALVAAVIAELGAPGPLSGMQVVITAGPTREPLDPVRYLSNRSSGRMGFAVAAAAREAGAEVVLISGPVALATPAGVTRVDVETASDMAEAVAARMDACDLFIAAAAVADFRPAEAAAGKIGKADAATTLPLTLNPDIVATVAAAKPRPWVVGFAAETDRVVERAREKRERKGLDLVAANRVGPGLGFDTDDNALVVIGADREQELGPAPKPALARELIVLVTEHIQQHTQETGGSARP
ncbi:MAG: bifunctional phosphopantothenoylcysteine decarboxylase/phosphopantothenate--cysteine ligase CoaBC [Pseudomonadota bacterium]